MSLPLTICLSNYYTAIYAKAEADSSVLSINRDYMIALITLTRHIHCTEVDYKLRQVWVTNFDIRDICVLL